MCPPTPNPFGIYAHVPWCVSRCRYCAFATTVVPDPPFDDWVAGILQQWRRVSPAFPGLAHSLYLGGGTPSLLPPRIVGQLVSTLPLQRDAEITLEANPGTLDDGRLAAFLAHGVNRFSLGVQTLRPHLFDALGRSHDLAQARAALEQVARSGARSWSADLIFALPGERLEDVRADLAELLRFDPPHVSIYGLSYEPGTPLWRDLRAGRVRPVPDDDWRDAYELIVETLGAAGLDRYEVSNFGRPGHRSRHNEATWRAGHYAGLGPAAHGFLPSGLRTQGHPTYARWRAELAGQTERPTPRQAATDIILSTLRHVDGLPAPLLARRTGHRVRPSVIAAMARAGLVRTDPDIRLTNAGFPVADGITTRFVGALEPADGHTPRGPHAHPP